MEATACKLLVLLVPVSRNYSLQESGALKAFHQQLFFITSTEPDRADFRNPNILSTIQGLYLSAEVDVRNVTFQVDSFIKLEGGRSKSSSSVISASTVACPIELAPTCGPAFPVHRRMENFALQSVHFLAASVAISDQRRLVRSDWSGYKESVSFVAAAVSEGSLDSGVGANVP